MDLNRVKRQTAWSWVEVAFKSRQGWAMVSGFEEGPASWLEATTRSTKVERSKVAQTNGSRLSPSCSSSDQMSSGLDENKNNNCAKKSGLEQMGWRATRLPSAQPDFEWVLRWTMSFLVKFKLSKWNYYNILNLDCSHNMYLFNFQLYRLACHFPMV